MADETTKRKIAILGGGIAGLTAAYELSRQAGWQDRFDITIYQLGWRLGGKCASSRGPRDRIEEHGIHGFVGSYYNALPMMADLYAELGRQPGQPLATFEEAFIGSNFAMMWEWKDGALAPWPSRMIPNANSPKDASTYKGLISSISAMLEFAGVAKAVLQQKHLLAPKLSALLDDALTEAVAALGAAQPLGPNHPLVGVIQKFSAALIPWLMKVGVTDDLRRAFTALDFLSTLIVGALTDDVEAEGYDPLDDENWSDWLARHGAQQRTIESPMAMTTVNICYQSANGDTSRTPAMAAGVYLNWTLRSFAFLGCVLWSFAAGTGETIIAPLYTVLKRRGVKFEFFQKVERLHLDPVDKKTVTSVDITVQATLKDPVAGYDPIIDVRDLPSWPATPIYDKLNEGDYLQQHRIDLESYWNGWPDANHPQLKSPRILHHGQDYDDIVFAISLGAVNYLCDELRAANPAWRDMTLYLPCVETQAMQIWLSDDMYGLGWREQLDDRANESACSATYIGPANGNEEFHHLIKWEDWSHAQPPKSIWYFCGLMPNYEYPPDFTDTNYPKRQRDRVKAQFIQYLQASIGHMLPNSTCQFRNPPGDPMSFDFSLLVNFEQDKGPIVSRFGVQHFDSQYWRANIDPSELYVTSPPGSTAYRMEAWGSGFKNLTLAGDWIYTGLNAGSVEGAVMSGKLASYALSAAPALDTIIGYPTMPRPSKPADPRHYPPPHAPARVG